MKKIFEKHETLCCMLLIVLYVVVNSYCMQNFGTADYRSAIVNTLFSVALLALVISLKRVSYYGLIKVEKVKKYLKDNEENLPSFSDEENLCYAVRTLYEQGEISLYDDDKATESDFSTEEFNWSEFEDKTVEQILGK